MWRVSCNCLVLVVHLLPLCSNSTLEERAKRLFATKGKSLSEIDPSLFAKSHKSRSDPTERQKEIALIEAQIYDFVELLSVRKGNIKIRLYALG